MKVLSYSAIAAAVLASTSSMAAIQVGESATNFFQTATHPAAISAEIGTLGYGANIAWGVNESTELQAGWSGMDLKGDTKLNANDSWINYDKVLGEGYGDFKGKLDYKVKYSNPYLAVQMRPFKNSFTVGTGVMVPKNELNIKVTSESTGNDNSISFDNNKNKFTLSDEAAIEVRAKNKNRLAPYATLGFRPNIGDRWGAFAEVGAAYMGDFKSTTKVTGTVKQTTKDGQNVAQAQAQAIENAKQELENKITNSVKTDLKWYPIAKVGVTYRF